MFKKLSFMLVLPALFACEDDSSNYYHEELANLQESRALWSSSYQKRYSFDQFIQCNCLAENTNFSFDIAEDHSIIFNTRNNQFSDAGGYGVQSIEGVFELIENNIEDAASFEIEYDETLGFPSYIRIDPDEDIVDEEIIIHLSNVVVDLNSVCLPVWKPSVTISVQDEQDDDLSCRADLAITLNGEKFDGYVECSEQIDLYNTQIGSYLVEVSADGYETELLEFDQMSGLCGGERDFSRQFQVIMLPVTP